MLTVSCVTHQTLTRRGGNTVIKITADYGRGENVTTYLNPDHIVGLCTNGGGGTILWLNHEAHGVKHAVESVGEVVGRIEADACSD